MVLLQRRQGLSLGYTEKLRRASLVVVFSFGRIHTYDVKPSLLPPARQSIQYTRARGTVSSMSSWLASMLPSVAQGILTAEWRKTQQLSLSEHRPIWQSKPRPFAPSALRTRRYVSLGLLHRPFHRGVQRGKGQHTVEDVGQASTPLTADARFFLVRPSWTSTSLLPPSPSI